HLAPADVVREFQAIREQYEAIRLWPHQIDHLRAEVRRAEDRPMLTIHLGQKRPRPHLVVLWQLNNGNLLEWLHAYAHGHMSALPTLRPMRSGSPPARAGAVASPAHTS